MSNVPVQYQLADQTVSVLNGTTAGFRLLNNKASGAYSKPVCVASQIFNIGNAPTLRVRGDWTTSGHVTTNVRATTLKLRADLPLKLVESYAFDGEKKIYAEARIVLYNSTAEQSIVSKLHVYQGDPTDTNTNWLLENTEEFIIPATSTIEVVINGYINPAYRHDVKISDTVMNMVFFDSGAQKTGTAPKVLFFSLYMTPVAGWDNSSGLIVTKPVSNGDITAKFVTNYTKQLMACNNSMHHQNLGTMAPIDQYTGNGVYGFELNMYNTTKVYHMFMPNTTYDSTTELRGGFWIPLSGMASEYIDGKFRYKIALSWMARCSASVTLSYSLLYGLAGAAGTTFSGGTLIPLAATANTNYEVLRYFYPETLTKDLSGKGMFVIVRVQRNGTNSTNVYHYASQFSAKVIPYV